MTKQLVGVLALLASSVGSAATVTVVPSNATPGIGNVFTVTLQVAGAANIGGFTNTLTWDNSKVNLTSALVANACASCLPGSGPVGTGTGTFDIITGSNGLRTLDVLPGVPPVNGNFDLSVLTFTAVAAGAMNFVVSQGPTDGWFDNDTAENTQVSFTQANIVVQGAPVPVPAAAWLLVSALGSMVVLKRRPA